MSHRSGEFLPRQKMISVEYSLRVRVNLIPFQLPVLDAKRRSIFAGRIFGRSIHPAKESLGPKQAKVADTWSTYRRTRHSISADTVATEQTDRHPDFLPFTDHGFEKVLSIVCV